MNRMRLPYPRVRTYLYSPACTRAMLPARGRVHTHLLTRVRFHTTDRQTDPPRAAPDVKTVDRRVLRALRRDPYTAVQRAITCTTTLADVQPVTCTSVPVISLHSFVVHAVQSSRLR